VSEFALDAMTFGARFTNRARLDAVACARDPNPVAATRSRSSSLCSFRSNHLPHQTNAFLTVSFSPRSFRVSQGWHAGLHGGPLTSAHGGMVKQKEGRPRSMALGRPHAWPRLAAPEIPGDRHQAHTDPSSITPRCDWGDFGGYMPRAPLCDDHCLRSDESRVLPLPQFLVSLLRVG
jgi:hypothetical protein